MPETNYFKIGVFVLVGFGLFVAGLLVFGLRDRLASSKVLCVTFFNRSVQGLSKDAAVKYRGFTIGRVTSLSLAVADDFSGQPLVRVDFEIDPSIFATQDLEHKDVPDFLRDEIAKGLKVFLTLQGVTGIYFLDLNYGKEPEVIGPAALEATDRIVQDDHLVYIPNSPSQIFEIGESISRLVRTMNDIDFINISRDLRKAIRAIDQAVGFMDAGRLSREASETMEEVRGLSASLRSLAGHLEVLLDPGEGGSLGQTMQTSAGQLRQSLRRLDQLLGSSRGGLPETLDNLRAITDNLREMSELLKNQPSQAIFGSPPRETEPGRGRENVTTFTLP